MDAGWQMLAHLIRFCPILYDPSSNICELVSRAYGTDIQPIHNLAIFGYSELMDTFA